MKVKEKAAFFRVLMAAMLTPRLRECKHLCVRVIICQRMNADQNYSLLLIHVILRKPAALSGFEDEAFVPRATCYLFAVEVFQEGNSVFARDAGEIFEGRDVDQAFGFVL
jgi:hypothetical protein